MNFLTGYCGEQLSLKLFYQFKLNNLIVIKGPNNSYCALKLTCKKKKNYCLMTSSNSDDDDDLNNDIKLFYEIKSNYVLINYWPSTVGQYTINITKNGTHINQSPYFFSIIDPLKDSIESLNYSILPRSKIFIEINLNERKKLTSKINQFRSLKSPTPFKNRTINRSLSFTSKSESDEKIKNSKQTNNIKDNQACLSKTTETKKNDLKSVNKQSIYDLNSSFDEIESFRTENNSDSEEFNNEHYFEIVSNCSCDSIKFLSTNTPEKVFKNTFEKLDINEKLKQEKKLNNLNKMNENSKLDQMNLIICNDKNKILNGELNDKINEKPLFNENKSIQLSTTSETSLSGLCSNDNNFLKNCLNESTVFTQDKLKINIVKKVKNNFKSKSDLENAKQLLQKHLESENEKNLNENFEKVFKENMENGHLFRKSNSSNKSYSSLNKKLESRNDSYRKKLRKKNHDNSLDDLLGGLDPYRKSVENLFQKLYLETINGETLLDSTIEYVINKPNILKEKSLMKTNFSEKLSDTELVDNKEKSKIIKKNKPLSLSKINKFKNLDINDGKFSTNQSKILNKNDKNTLNKFGLNINSLNKTGLSKNNLIKNDLIKNDLPKNSLVKNSMVKNSLSKNSLSKNDLNKNSSSKNDLNKNLSKNDLNKNSLSKNDLSKSFLSKNKLSKNSFNENGLSNNDLNCSDSSKISLKENLSENRVKSKKRIISYFTTSKIKNKNSNELTNSEINSKISVSSETISKLSTFNEFNSKLSLNDNHSNNDELDKIDNNDILPVKNMVEHWTNSNFDYEADIKTSVQLPEFNDIIKNRKAVFEKNTLNYFSQTLVPKSKLIKEKSKRNFFSNTLNYRKKSTNDIQSKENLSQYKQINQSIENINKETKVVIPANFKQKKNFWESLCKKKEKNIK